MMVSGRRFVVPGLGFEDHDFRQSTRMPPPQSLHFAIYQSFHYSIPPLLLLLTSSFGAYLFIPILSRNMIPSARSG